VIEASPFRSAAVRIRRGRVSRTVTLTGLEPASDFYRLVGTGGERHALPSGGVVVTVGLARALDIAPGDSLDVELLERGETRRLFITGRYDPMIGQGLFATRDWVNALLREQDVADGAYFAIAPGSDSAVFARMKDLPGVAAVTSRAATIANIEDQMRESMVFVLSLIIFSSCLIAIGVVYNNARVALSERGRELASLRVLGFTVNEVWSMQLGEQAAIVLLSIPVGVGIGALFSFALVKGFETERFHFPFVVALRSQLFAAAVVTLSAVLAGLVIRRRIRRLDMVAALRSRE
jgi:putative ABC transport system permease protein